MKNKLLVISFFASLLSCTNADTKIHQEENTDSISNEKRVATTDTNVSKNKVKQQQPNELAKKILGTWALVGGENASFVFEKDKVDYPETFTSYKYSLIGDNIQIKYDDYTGRFFVKMKGGDTLILIGDEEQVYYRFKE